jgi:predicted O-linked N-acetylglucosamine transferase (SPINDLY family)
MGFSTLVADTDDEYIRLAIKLANDKAFNAWCRSEILNRKGKLINRTDVIGGFADLFESICPRYSS